ncbi:MAG: hypothetical protein H0T46_03280 [Deltaproteobacteria bacterium]|nr:hypothetical protein [Deltaproteobacteria bacterium]
MRTILTTAAVLLIATVAPAAAEDLTGTYDVKYEEVSTNCPSPLKYQHGKLEVKKTSTGVNVDINRTPVMQGSVTKAGKVSAKSKAGPTMLDGMNGVFSVAGKITAEGVLTFVMVGEYTAGGKALCSQSWNVVGSRADATPATPPKKKSTDTEQMFVPSVLR